MTGIGKPVKPAVCGTLLTLETSFYRETGGVSENNRNLGFHPAFSARETADDFSRPVNNCARPPTCGRFGLATRFADQRKATDS